MSFPVHHCFCEVPTDPTLTNCVPVSGLNLIILSCNTGMFRSQLEVSILPIPNSWGNQSVKGELGSLPSCWRRVGELWSQLPWQCCFL